MEDNFQLNRKYIQIELEKWQNSTKSSVVWKSPSEINDVVLKTKVLFGLIQKYFDSDDYETPIKRIFDSRFSYQLLTKLHKKSSLFIKRTNIALYDNIWNPDAKVDYSYYSAESYKDDFEVIETTENNLLTLYLVQDSTSESFERRVYTVMDLFGQLGGIYGILTIIGGYLVNSFWDKMYQYSFFNKLYFVNKKSRIVPDPIPSDIKKDASFTEIATEQKSCRSGSQRTNRFLTTKPSDIFLNF